MGWRARLTLRCHRPAWPGDPVRRGLSGWSQASRRTGSPLSRGWRV